MRNEIVAVIIKVADEQRPMLTQPIETARGEAARLYGPQGSLDSLGLVRFIVDLEAALEERFGQTVVLVDEKAMSQKRSPFLTIGSLASHIEQRLTPPASP